ncbi:hypothetical protein FOA52_009630 [Chlamydomonas sp. UWO 241]|nr:hypothetical protein FOA52_009630 [Chlamydomonas sp. UWO 241]
MVMMRAWIDTQPYCLGWNSYYSQKTASLQYALVQALRCLVSSGWLARAELVGATSGQAEDQQRCGGEPLCRASSGAPGGSACVHGCTGDGTTEAPLEHLLEHPSPTCSSSSSIISCSSAVSSVVADAATTSRQLERHLELASSSGSQVVGTAHCDVLALSSTHYSAGTRIPTPRTPSGAGSARGTGGRSPSGKPPLHPALRALTVSGSLGGRSVVAAAAAAAQARHLPPHADEASLTAGRLAQRDRAAHQLSLQATRSCGAAAGPAVVSGDPLVRRSSSASDWRLAPRPCLSLTHSPHSTPRSSEDGGSRFGPGRSGGGRGSDGGSGACGGSVGCGGGDSSSSPRQALAQRARAHARTNAVPRHLHHHHRTNSAFFLPAPPSLLLLGPPPAVSSSSEDSSSRDTAAGARSAASSPPLPLPFLPACLRLGLCCEQGTRASNEDYAFGFSLDPLGHSHACFTRCACLGLFDGHGGDEVAKHLTEALPALIADRAGGIARGGGAEVAQLLLELEEQLELRYQLEWAPHERDPGSTALIATAMDGTLLVANVGDCRLLLISEALDSSGARACYVSKATADHHPRRNPSEAARLKAAGARVDASGYIGSETSHGLLEVSRSIGDFASKAELGSGIVIATPDLYAWALGPDDALLVAVTDGISGVMDDTEIVNMVCQLLNDRRTPNDPAFAARELATFAAFAKQSTDNCSAVVLCLKGRHVLHYRTRGAAAALFVWR